MDAKYIEDSLWFLLGNLETPSKQYSNEEWNNTVDSVEQKLCEADFALFQIKHRFCNGLYIRECELQEGCVITGKIHKVHSVFNLLSGSVSMRTADKHKVMHAPFTKIVEPGTRVVVYSITDSRAQNVYPNPENKSVTEIEKDIYDVRSDHLTQQQFSRINAHLSNGNLALK
jgi:hypothetical protein